MFDAELAGINADQCFAPAHHEQNEKVDAGHTVGQKGGASSPRRPHVQALGQNEDGVEDHVENTPAHGADAGVQAGALRPDQIGHDHIENGGHRAQADRPAQIAAGGATGDIGGAQHPEQRAVEADAEQRDERPARHGAPEAEGRGAADGIVILEAQGSAHQTGAAHAEQIVHRVECQQHRGRQRNRRVLDRVIEHSHKPGIGQVIQHHDQRAQDGGDRQRGDGPGQGHGFKQFGPCCRLCHFNLRCPGLARAQKHSGAVYPPPYAGQPTARRFLLFYNHAPALSIEGPENPQRVGLLLRQRGI